MTILSLRLPSELLKEADAIAKQKKISRATYIRESLKKANEKVLQGNKKKRLKEASMRVRSESMKINKEFAKTEKEINY